MHCPRMEGGVGVTSGGNSIEAFVDIGTLIIEGRLPAPGTSRGYKEGPHCPVTNTALHANHQCDTTNSFLCQRAEKLRKHLSLLCSNSVSMCVEVLLCLNCECGLERAQSPEVANIPSSSDLLLEQWTVSVLHNSSESCGMTVKGLFQAVRSQLHFSQLSAWWSSSKGTSPKNVCFRVTLPGAAFASQFTKQPIVHSFPIAAVNSDVSLKVLVCTLPRCETLPVLICLIHSTSNSTIDVEVNVRKKSIGLEQPLLGESLLDPPGRRPAERLSSPCTRTPMIGSWRMSGSMSRRHPGSSRPSGILKQESTAGYKDSGLTSVPIISGLVDDRMQTSCNRPGKHHCKCEDDTECLGISEDLPRIRRRSQVTPHSSNTSPNTEVYGEKKLSFDLSHREVEDVLIVLRSQNNFTSIRNLEKENSREERKLNLPKNQPSTSELSSDQLNKSSAKSDIFLSAILRSNEFQSDQKFSLKRKHDIEDEVYNAENFYQSNLKIGCELGRINSKKTVHDVSVKNQNCFLNKSKQCTYEPIKVNNNSTVTNVIDSYRTTEAGNKSIKEVYCSIANKIRTKQCDKKQIGSFSAKYDKFDADLLDKINSLDLNKNIDVSNGRGVPTALEKAKFRRSLDSAASMVFHWRTGLPLTSSPAPLRRASHRFDFDSSINSVSAISSALFDPADSISVSSEDTESEGSAKSPSSPNLTFHRVGVPWPIHYQGPSSSLLGSFEESVLNGRLEPVSTVQGFTADLGASGTFCPRHSILPVTVFFYTLGDNDKVSTPYLAHINLGKKGYVVPRGGTIQVTLLNPLGTVIKMFVVIYDLSDMPVNSHTFLRQRTLYMPTSAKVPEGSSQKYLRYLIHLRFSSSKSGRIYLHTDIRMIIFRKSDLDTATGHGMENAYELRSFTHGPTNPKFSPRK
uniref:Atos-like conserved domain-containing protein n=1 Tax=Clastoptera arizonana TaxID=38151 RepID=A0A1B6DH39_9HEMI